MKKETKIAIGLTTLAVIGIACYMYNKNKEEKKSSATGGMWCPSNCSGTQRSWCKGCLSCPNLPCNDFKE